jgi:hypothetical protein
MHRLALGTALLALLAACSGSDDSSGVIPADLGPMEYDESGAMPCSKAAPKLDEACGFRVVYSATGAEVWIADIAYSDVIRYRVLTFAGGAFTDRDGAALSTERQGDAWLVGVNGSEFYSIPADVLTAG